jgi:hypothetical protein
MDGARRSLGGEQDEACGACTSPHEGDTRVDLSIRLCLRRLSRCAKQPLVF